MEESTNDSADREVRPEQTLEDGSKYTGSWDKKSNLPDGNGKSVMVDGSIYEGQWR